MLDRIRKGMCLAVSLFFTLLAVASQSESETIMVSVSSSGSQGNLYSSYPSISADGRFVAFSSLADNLVANDTNGTWDVFVHDRETGETMIVSVSSSGVQGNGFSQSPSISADGRFVAFESSATNLVENDTNNSSDVFIHDRLAGQTERVSVDSSGIQGNRESYGTSISSDGRFVAFYSYADNLMTNDTNGGYDAFVHDRLTGQTERVSVSTSGVQGNGFSQFPSISADGRFVAFESSATNLVENDTNNTVDIFVRNRLTGQTERVSVSTSGVQGNGFSQFPSISADGRFVVFESSATNLVENDTNKNSDAFVHDRLTGQTERVSVDSSGIQGNTSAISYAATISADGRFVAFHSVANNLVADDTNDTWDVFRHDRLTDQTKRVSVSSSGAQGDDSSVYTSISADGRFVAFESSADNIVSPDTNNREDVFVHDSGLQLTDTPCSATLTTDLILHIPIVDFQGSAYWVDFRYVPDTLDFVMTDAGVVVDDTAFRGCTHSVLSNDLKFGLPDIMFAGKSYWIELTYKEGLTVTATWAGEN